MINKTKRLLGYGGKVSAIALLLAGNIAYAQESIPMIPEHHSVKPQTVLIGSWTGPTSNPLAQKTAYPSEGIYRVKMNPDGSLLPLDRIKLDNPSWIVFSKDHKYLYTTNESEEGQVTALSVTEDGKLKFINTVSSQGQHPTHAVLTPDGHFLLAANYAASRKNAGVIIFPVHKNGKLGDSVQHISLTKGSGAVADRQDTGHAHSVNITPDGKMLFVADLGADKVHAYRYSADNKTPFAADPAADLTLPAGSGPRHMTFSPDGKFAYLITEMGANIHVYAVSSQGLKEVQTAPLTDSVNEKDKGGGGILFSPDGKFLYAANRQSRNEIIAFPVDKATGKLGAAKSYAAGGVEPRAFAFDSSGQYMLIANVYSNSVTELYRDAKDGSLKPTGVALSIGTPTDVKFLP